MAKLSTDELIDAFKEMTLLELSEFVKTFEEVFEVTAPPRSPSPPRAVPPGRRGRRGAVGVRRHPRVGRRQEDRRHQRSSARSSRAWASRRPRTSSTRPKPLLEKVAKEAAEEAKAKLEAAGATVTVK